MFEEHITDTWICPVHGEVEEVEVRELTRRVFKKGSLGTFEYSGGIHNEMSVQCKKCGSECCINESITDQGSVGHESLPKILEILFE